MAENLYGKYRGVVTEVGDGKRLGQLKARVDDLAERAESGWALPCLPFSIGGMGVFCLPRVDDRVWIEFEKGDPNYPIWSGCFWLSEEENKLPKLVTERATDKLLLRTKGGHSLLLDDSDSDGGITIESSGKQKIAINSKGIQIENSDKIKVELKDATVAINDDALEVT